MRLGGAGAVFPRLFVGRRNCTRLPFTTGPPNVDKLRSTSVIASKNNNDVFKKLEIIFKLKYLPFDSEEVPIILELFA